MNIFIDTNVLIAAFIARGGQCADLFEHCTTRHAVFTSRFVLKELADKLQKKFKFQLDDIEESLRIVLACTVLVSETPLQTALCRDSDDDHVIAAAVTAKADCILTGDKDLLDLKKVHGIQMVSPGNFWRFEASKET